MLPYLEWCLEERMFCYCDYLRQFRKVTFTRTSSTYWPFIPTAIALLRTSSPAVAPAIINLFLFLSVNETMDKSKKKRSTSWLHLQNNLKLNSVFQVIWSREVVGLFIKERRNQEGTNCQSNEGREYFVFFVSSCFYSLFKGWSRDSLIVRL